MMPLGYEPNCVEAIVRSPLDLVGSSGPAVPDYCHTYVSFPRSPLNWLAWVGNLTTFGLRVVPRIAAAVVRPSYWVRPFYAMTVGAMPLAGVTGVALGVVIWLHTRDVLARTGTGAVEYLPTFLAAAVLLELAPVGAGLIVAVRTGASLGAELASMRVGEQLDALELLGVSPLARLIGPRVAGLHSRRPRAARRHRRHCPGQRLRGRIDHWSHHAVEVRCRRDAGTRLVGRASGGTQNACLRTGRRHHRVFHRHQRARGSKASAGPRPTAW